MELSPSTIWRKNQMLNLKKQLSCPLPKEKKHIFTGEGHKNHGAIFSCATGKLKICAEEITNKLRKNKIT